MKLIFIKISQYHNSLYKLKKIFRLSNLRRQFAQRIKIKHQCNNLSLRNLLVIILHSLKMMIKVLVLVQVPHSNNNSSCHSKLPSIMSKMKNNSCFKKDNKSKSRLLITLCQSKHLIHSLVIGKFREEYLKNLKKGLQIKEVLCLK